MRHYLSDQLQKYGHRVTITDCHEGMMAAINDNMDFALLISDLGLDGRDDFNLVQELEKLAPNMRMIFMAGFSAIGVASSGEQDFFNARIITRPFHIRELPEQINAILSAEAAA